MLELVKSSVFKTWRISVFWSAYVNFDGIKDQVDPHCSLMLIFSLTNTSKSFSSGLLSVYSPPSLYLFLGLPQPRCSTLHLAFLNFIRVTQAHILSLSRSFWMTSLPSIALTTPYSLVSPGHLVRVHSSPLSMSPRKMLNSASPDTDLRNCY